MDEFVAFIKSLILENSSCSVSLVGHSNPTQPMLPLQHRWAWPSRGDNKALQDDVIISFMLVLETIIEVAGRNETFSVI